jgi:hypothetical protein
MNRYALATSGALWILLAGAACRPDQPTATTASSPADPVATLQAIRQWHRARQYRLIEQYVVPDRRAHLVDTLVAVDQVLAADRRLRDVLGSQFGPEAALWLDLSFLEFRLGPFSRQVTVVQSRSHDRGATVTIQIADRVPLVDVAFVQNDAGRWQYQPDEPIPDMPKLLGRLAGALDALADEMSSPGATAEQLERSCKERIIPLIQALGSLAQPERSTPRPPPR